MKKMYNFYRTAMISVLILIVAIGLFPNLGNAQENDPPNFAIPECMKVKPENESRVIPFAQFMLSLKVMV